MWRGINVSNETVRYWWEWFGAIFAAEIRKTCAEQIRTRRQWHCHLDEVFVRVKGQTDYLCREARQNHWRPTPVGFPIILPVNDQIRTLPTKDR